MQASVNGRAGKGGARFLGREERSSKMKKTLGVLAVATLAAGVASANADSYVLNVQDWAPSDFFSFGDPSPNPNVQIDLGAGSIVTGVAIDLSVTADGQAFLSDFGIAFMPIEVVGHGGPGLILTPGVLDDFGGTMQYTDFWDLEGDPETPDAFELASGILWVEGFDWYEEFPALTDINGTITIYYSSVPAPGALALLGVAGVVGVSRRRRG